MRYVSQGEPLQRVCTILGDTIATIETHYSERVFTAEDKMAFHRGKQEFQKGKFGRNISAGVLNSGQIPARAPHSEGYGL